VALNLALFFNEKAPNMRKGRSSEFIRGGQTTQHWWQMASQVASTSLKMGAVVYLVSFIGLIVLNFRLAEINEGYLYYMADLNVNLLLQPDFQLTYATEEGRSYTKTALEMYHDPALRAKYDAYAAEAELYYEISFIPAIVAGLGLAVYFYFIGSKLSDSEHIRGSRLVAPEELDRWSRRKWKDYIKKVPAKKGTKPYTLAGIPFPPNTVEAQTGIFGTVGVGKTNAMKELLATIRAEKGRAVIYDKMGAFVRNYYNPETDIILNMFDARSVGWSPFYEADTPEAFAQIAEVMIPQKPGQNDPFWSVTARLVFEYAARALMKEGTMTNKALRHAILTMPADSLEALVQNTPGALFFGGDIKKTSASIRANMIAELRFLEFLRDDGEIKFSMRKWVASERPGFVFLTGDAEHSAATRNVISTVIEVAANALMAGPERRDPSLWFFLDEVPSLNRLPFLPTKLAEIRQFGGAFVLGYQVYSQLEDLYGDKAAQSISGTLNNRIVFNTPDARTARLFSDSLGLADIVEHRETISFGADVTRDGNSLNSQRVERPIVTASEIQSLPQFKAYIRFGYDAPTALVQFPPITTQEVAPAVVKYAGNGFAVGSMDAIGPDGEAVVSAIEQAASQALYSSEAAPARPFLALPAVQQLAEFDEWFDRKSAKYIDRETFTLTSKAKPEDKPLAWEHYFVSRVKGEADPELWLIDYTSHYVSNLPEHMRPKRVEIPPLEEVMRRRGEDARLSEATRNQLRSPVPSALIPAPSPPAPQSSVLTSLFDD
jgi:type IV conjugative transfer system coupling protein TraD